MHGDSFTEKLLHILAESFGRLVFCQMPSLDYEVVQEVQPGRRDRPAERAVPPARALRLDGATQAELEASKRMQGKVYGPRTTWETPRVDSFD